MNRSTLNARRLNISPALKKVPGKKLSLKTLLLYGVAALAAIGLLYISQNVHQIERKHNKLRADVISEQERIRVLEAEWAYLNSPQRLEALAQKYLDVHALEPGQLTGQVPPSVQIQDINVTPPLPNKRSSVLYQEVSSTSAMKTEVQNEESFAPPPPGRKPSVTRRSFDGLLKKLQNGGAQ